MSDTESRARGWFRRLRLRWLRCGYCGHRDRKHKAYTRWGWFSWTTCRKCEGVAPFIDEHLPPPFATADRDRTYAELIEAGIVSHG